jgi:methylmalonyl-CoA/ethylmalonyl-CoA epimerase
MFRKIEHIGIAVKNVEAANAMFARLAEVGLLKMEKVESEGVTVSFFQIGDTKIEFLEADTQESAIARHIDKNGEGLHHIAFEVENIEKEMERLKKEGFTLLSDKPKEGADSKRICFVHPRDTSRVLVELCQDILPK